MAIIHGILDWRAAAAECCRAVSYAGVAFGLYPLFRQRHMALFGWWRWLILGCLLLSAGLQFVIMGLLAAGRLDLALDVVLPSAAALLPVACGLRRFFKEMRWRNAELVDAKITKLKAELERAAGETRSWMQMAEQIGHVGHWRIGLPDYELFWSDEIYRIHGRDKAAYVPEIASAIEVFHPDDRPMIRAAIENAAAGRAGYEWRARLLRPDGELRHVLSRGITQYDESGQPSCLFGVFLDITEQTEREESLRRAREAAERANGALRDMALLDALTGLPNRRDFDMAWEREVKRAAREGTKLGLIMIDLDYFKGYNDYFGHPAGDECLRQVAAAIAAVPRRPGDITARYGGEEFVALLPNTGAAGCEALAEAVRQSVLALGLPHPANPAGLVTVSCGVAALTPRDGTAAAAQLLERADRALYEAKMRGRNQVVRALAAA